MARQALKCTTRNAGDGYHTYPYHYQNWLIDMGQWAEVRAGSRQPWDIRPYAYYPVTYQPRRAGITSLAALTIRPTASST